MSHASMTRMDRPSVGVCDFMHHSWNQPRALPLDIPATYVGASGAEPLGWLASAGLARSAGLTSPQDHKLASFAKIGA
jgi:hypothetical protein